ncbi:unnamed protein product [Pleuronectes platessa]|uniref:Uncharacterized protein n=1 Tax=Pleuronectes platessa TaxID=8262 RepID=A0A9N7VE28_PLEPL|nr:unnamed protein product [Pleuronectes platessa]
MSHSGRDAAVSTLLLVLLVAVTGREATEDRTARSVPRCGKRSSGPFCAAGARRKEGPRGRRGSRTQPPRQRGQKTFTSTSFPSSGTRGGGRRGRETRLVLRLTSDFVRNPPGFEEL